MVISATSCGIAAVSAVLLSMPTTVRIIKYDVNDRSSYLMWWTVRTMQRVTITIDDDLVAEIDAFMTGRGYANRSEASRDLARSGLSQSPLEVARGSERR